METISRLTLLDLARQRLDYIARSPNWTRAARQQAAGLRDKVAAELEAVAAGAPSTGWVE